MPTPTFTDPWLPAPDGGGYVATNRPATKVEVFRVNFVPGQGQSNPTDYGYVLLPNVACVAIEEREGAIASAQFRYKFDGRDAQGPQTFEEALSLDFTTPSLQHLVGVGDRVAVRATRPDGGTQWLFCGPPLLWSFSIDRATEAATFTAVGDAKRAWDTPVKGAVYRNADRPEFPSDVATDLVAQFNPRGIPNASPGTADSGDTLKTYPVFLDPGIRGIDSRGKPYPRPWTLPMAVAHVLYRNNPDESWVKTPTRAELDALLVSREPIDGVPFNPNDPATYTSAPIDAPDTPATGRPWPAVVHDLVRDYGFGMRFDLGSDLGGNPITTLKLFLKQGGATKPLLLAARGGTFTPTATNLGAAQMGRDLSGVVNQWDVIGAQTRFEFSGVLAPGFPAQQADSATPAALAVFNAADPAFALGGNHDAYRLWVFDETGEGHYPNNPSILAGPPFKVSGTATSLDAVLGSPDTSRTPPTPRYVKRRRPPIGQLVTLDVNGKRLRYQLSVSTDYSGSYPGVWDGTGTWQPVQGGFELLKDRLGIRVTSVDPNSWAIGVTSVAGMPFPAGILKAVEQTGNPSSGGGAKPPFFLRLTCVIEGDQAVRATAARQGSSPLLPAIARQIDARDRLFFEQVAAHSEFNTSASPLTVRDDTPLALAEAVAARTESEAGVFEGTAAIPRFTAAYAVGDRIDQVRGRNLSLRTDNAGAAFAPVLPVVVARRWALDGEQRTFLELSDSGLTRKRYGLVRKDNAKAPAPVKIKARKGSP